MSSCIGVKGELNESKLFEWKIADFFSLSKERNYFYKSPSFTFENTSLHLEIYPGGHVDSVPGFISLFLRNESVCPFRINTSLHIKKADGSLKKLIKAYSEDVAIEPSEKQKWYEFYERCYLEQNKSELAPSGTLTIVYILKSIDDEKPAAMKADNREMLHAKQTDETSDYQTLTELDVLSENLKDLSANKDSCDVVLEVEDKEFKAHKAILMARSPVFAAMFQHDTLEKQTGFIKIPDCDSESFQEFLDYLYRGKLEKVSFRSAFHLYSTSNKYEIQKLKEFCIKYLIKSLSSDNVCDIAKMADTYDEIELMTETQNFFSENLSRIFLTTEWQSLMKNDFHLANKLLVEYSKAKGSK